MSQLADALRQAEGLILVGQLAPADEQVVIDAVIAAYAGTQKAAVVTGGLWNFGDNPDITENQHSGAGGHHGQVRPAYSGRTKVGFPVGDTVRGAQSWAGSMYTAGTASFSFPTTTSIAGLEPLAASASMLVAGDPDAAEAAGTSRRGCSVSPAARRLVARLEGAGHRRVG
ncbi:hypothetical protein [Paractinoplanes toevensis]|uniref:hypothetical protein n=1 Tax=Paractinoplanes toevensis TaxID=571911 RepID=UPI001BB45A5F|nr:hypothetical protein [Actinoplanes toevensis]